MGEEEKTFQSLGLGGEWGRKIFGKAEKPGLLNLEYICAVDFKLGLTMVSSPRKLQCRGQGRARNSTVSSITKFL